LGAARLTRRAHDNYRGRMSRALLPWFWRTLPRAPCYTTMGQAGTVPVYGCPALRERGR